MGSYGDSMGILRTPQIPLGCPYLGGPFVELRCLGSGIHFELLGSGFLRNAWIMCFSYLNCLRKLKNNCLDRTLFFHARLFVFYDFVFIEFPTSKTKDSGVREKNARGNREKHTESF